MTTYENGDDDSFLRAVIALAQTPGIEFHAPKIHRRWRDRLRFWRRPISPLVDGPFPLVLPEIRHMFGEES